MAEKHRVLHGEEIFKCEPLPPFVIYKLFGKGDRVLIHADKGVGKSLTALDIVCHLTTGNPLLDTYEVAGEHKVLWLLGESTQSNFVKRLNKMSENVPIKKDNLYFLKCHRKRFNVQREFDKLMNQLLEKNVKYDIIILDSLYNFVAGKKNDDDIASEWLANADVLLDTFDASMIALGHMGKSMVFQSQGGGHEVVSKGASAKGAVEWDAAFTIIYELSVVNKKNNILRLVNHKDREGECIDELTFKLIVPQTDKQKRLMMSDDVKDDGSNQFRIKAFLKNGNAKFTLNEICEGIPIAQSSFYSAVKHCLKEKSVEKEADEYGIVSYWYTGV